MSNPGGADHGIGARVRQARDISGLSQAQLAKLMGIGRPAVSEIETGVRKISTDELISLCEILDVTANWLLHGRVNDSADPRLELAARELKKLKSEQLDSLLNLLTVLRAAENPE